MGRRLVRGVGGGGRDVEAEVALKLMSGMCAAG